MSVFVGIDPGLKGYMATLYSDGQYALLPLPRQGSLLDARAWQGQAFLIPAGAHILVEQQFAKGRGGKTVLTNYGALLSHLRVAGHDPDTVSATKWKKHYGLTRDKGESDAAYKQRSVNLIDLLRPDIFTPELTHDAAEAVLIALYAQELYERRND